MICTGVVPCLSSSLAKNNEIMSMFVPFFLLFWLFRKFGFFPKTGGQTLYQSSETGYSKTNFKDITIK